MGFETVDPVSPGKSGKKKGKGKKVVGVKTGRDIKAPPGLEEFFEDAVSSASPVSPPDDWSSGVLEAAMLFGRVHVEKVAY